MRTSTAIAALFAAGALAGPAHHKHQHAKKDIAYDTVWDYVYETVYVTEGDIPATAAPAAPTDGANVKHYGHGPHHAEPTSAPAPAYTPAPVTSEEPAPAYTPEAPAYTPEPTSYAPAAAPSGYGTGDSYSQAVVNHHNFHRANHSSPDIAWDDELAAWAQQIGETCVYDHSNKAGDGKYGQNIAAGVDSTGISVVISNMFYNGEITEYLDDSGNNLWTMMQEAGSNLSGVESDITDNTNTAFEKWGHMSQIVWADTTHVGCATVDCHGSGLANAGGAAPYFTVCNYRPAGNVQGGYTKNVKIPLNHPSVVGSGA